MLEVNMLYLFEDIWALIFNESLEATVYTS